MATLTDQAAAMIHVAQLMQKVADQTGRGALHSEVAQSRLSDVTDLGQKTVHRHFLLEALLAPFEPFSSHPFSAMRARGHGGRPASLTDGFFPGGGFHPDHGGSGGFGGSFGGGGSPFAPAPGFGPRGFRLVEGEQPDGSFQPVLTPELLRQQTVGFRQGESSQAALRQMAAASAPSLSSLAKGPQLASSPGTAALTTTQTSLAAASVASGSSPLTPEQAAGALVRHAALNQAMLPTGSTVLQDPALVQAAQATLQPQTTKGPDDAQSTFKGWQNEKKLQAPGEAIGEELIEAAVVGVEKGLQKGKKAQRLRFAGLPLFMDPAETREQMERGNRDSSYNRAMRRVPLGTPLDKAWFGLGKRIDPQMHLSPDFMAGHLTKKLLDHGKVDAPLIAQLNAHLQGGEAMSQAAFKQLRAQAANKPASSKDALGDSDLEHLTASYRMGRRKRVASANMAQGKKLLDEEKRQDDTTVRTRQKKLQKGDGETQGKGSGLVGPPGHAGGHWLPSLEESREIFAGTLAKTFKASLLGMMNAGDAASPDAFATMSGSFKLLAAELGTNLMPEMVAVSRMAQDMAHWFGGLSESGRTTVKVIAGLGLAAGALAYLSPQLLAVGSVVKHLLWSTGAASMLGHVATTVAPIVPAALTMYMPYRMAKLQNEELDENQEKIRAAKAHLAGFKMSTAEMESHPLFKDIKEDAKKLGVSDDAVALPAIGRRQAELLRERQQLNTQLTMHGDRSWDDYGGKRSFMETLRAGLPVPFLGGLDEDKLTQVRGKITDNMAEHAKLQTMKDYFKTKESPEKQAQKLLSPSEQASQVHQANQLLLDYQNRVQPAYFGVEDMYKKIQIEALAESPLQQKIREIQLNQYEELLKQSGYLKQMAEKGEIPARLN